VFQCLIFVFVTQPSAESREPVDVEPPQGRLCRFLPGELIPTRCGECCCQPFALPKFVFEEQTVKYSEDRLTVWTE
jgi:hypothetical protein